MVTSVRYLFFFFFLSSPAASTILQHEHPKGSTPFRLLHSGISLSWNQARAKSLIGTWTAYGRISLPYLGLRPDCYLILTDFQLFLPGPSAHLTLQNRICSARAGTYTTSPARGDVNFTYNNTTSQRSVPSQLSTVHIVHASLACLLKFSAETKRGVEVCKGVATGELQTRYLTWQHGRNANLLFATAYLRLKIFGLFESSFRY